MTSPFHDQRIRVLRVRFGHNRSNIDRPEATQSTPATATRKRAEHNKACEATERAAGSAPALARHVDRHGGRLGAGQLVLPSPTMLWVGVARIRAPNRHKEIGKPAPGDEPRHRDAHFARQLAIPDQRATGGPGQYRRSVSPRRVDRINGHGLLWLLSVPVGP
jgi:hypothetical protein